MLQTALRCPQAQHMWLIEEPRLLNDKMCHLRLSQIQVDILNHLAQALPALHTEFRAAYVTVFEVGLGQGVQINEEQVRAIETQREHIFAALRKPDTCFLHHQTAKVLRTLSHFGFESGWYLSSLESYLYASIAILSEADAFHRYEQNDLLALLMDLALFDIGLVFEALDQGENDSQFSMNDGRDCVEKVNVVQEGVLAEIERATLATTLAQMRVRSCIQTPEIEQERQRSSDLANELSNAIHQKQICLYFQPKYDLIHHRLAGVEALVRWQHPQRGMVSPVEFIPLAEETGLILDLGKHIFELACQAQKSWRSEGRFMPPIAVNVSPQQFSDQGFAQYLIETLQHYQLEGRDFSLELTESVFVNDEEELKNNLLTLKAHGFSLALDDFGTGYSALSYLRQLPFDYVKVDQSFVRELPANAGDVAITKAVIAMAHSLGLTVIAEGVETEAQLSFLYSLHCDQVQGFFYARPMPQEVLAQWMMTPPNIESILHQPQQQKRLLLVDDETNILASLKRLLRRDGYQIFTCENGAEGLKFLQSNQVDVIISDQRMPEMTGVEFLREAKRLYPDTVRIILSGYSEIRYITEAVNEGAIYKFLSKPWDDEMLRQNIADAFQFKAMIDENQMLHHEIQNRNHELAKMNRQLSDLSKLQAHQLEVDRVNLQVIDEILHQLPFPIIGLSQDQQVAFCNEAALKKLWPGKDLYEMHIADLDSTLAEQMQAKVDNGYCDLVLQDRVYRAAWKRMGKLSPSAGLMLMFMPRCEARLAS